MISTNDFHSGVFIVLDGQIHEVVESQHVKPGKGPAFVRATLRNLSTGALYERTFNAGVKVEQAIVERRPGQYLYPSGDTYFIMDNETFEQFPVPREMFGEQVRFLKENMPVDLVLHEGRVLGVHMPNVVELRVVETEPGVRGDTASNATKSAKLETGVSVRVPLFIETGDVLRIDTRTGEYIGRA
ncbi:MAG: elongation factor P [Bacillota bacterium]|nr:elongation factor P [Bacillota bacterium]